MKWLKQLSEEEFKASVAMFHDVLLESIREADDELKDLEGTDLFKKTEFFWQGRRGLLEELIHRFVFIFDLSNERKEVKK